MTQRPVIILTGGQGGGKSTQVAELQRDPVWTCRFITLPETIEYAKCVNIPRAEKLFQRVMVNLQMALEDGLQCALEPTDPRVIICHRGSLDPLAYCLQRGWSEEEFFAFTKTSREEHYQRYAAVIQLVTAADGATYAYTRWPQAHRPETPEDAIRLDRWLEQAWRDHPHYFRLDNTGRTWSAKSAEARRILANLISRAT